MSETMEKILLSPVSLQQSGLKPEEATLEKVVNLLKLPSALRNGKSIALLQALTKKVNFFIQKIQEIGEEMHFESCKCMTYHCVPAGEVTYI